jgi:hypothetical protein
VEYCDGGERTCSKAKAARNFHRSSSGCTHGYGVIKRSAVSLTMGTGGAEALAA